MTWIKKTYLYLVSLISLVIIVIGSIMLINLALKQWIFTKADEPWKNYPMYTDCTQYMTEGETQLDYKPIECNPEALEKQELADKENRTAQKQRSASQALAMILVGAPVLWYHWGLARKED